MKFSFLLCTLNRKVLAINAIKSILNQTYDNYEIIVVDQSSENSKDEYEIIDKRIIYIHSEKRGLSYNRNIGIDISTGDYICLMDDDATYAPNNLINIKKTIDAKNADIVCGMMLDPISKEISLHGMKKNSLIIKQNNIMEYCSSPSLVISSKYAKQLKFDDDFGVGRRWGCAEEVDLVLRALYKGAIAYYDPSIIVFHPSVNKKSLKVEKAAAYSLGYGACCAKHYIKYGNTEMRKYYRVAIIKHVAAYLFYFISHDSKMKEMYQVNLKNKHLGYREYCMYIGKGTESNE